MRKLLCLLFFMSMQNFSYSSVIDREEVAVCESSVKVDVLKGNEIIPYLSKIAELRLSYYKEYPYLYEGTSEEEENYLRTYGDSENALVVLAQKEGDIVGIVMGVPLPESMKENHKSFQGIEVAPEEIFYLGESIFLAKAENLQEPMYRQFETEVKKFEKYKAIVVCEIERAADDPKKLEYFPVEFPWSRLGFTKNSDQFVYYTWKEIGDVESSQHLMIFWSKLL